MEAAGTAPALERAENALERCAAIIEGGKRFLLAMHEFPDGDALGSALALASTLTEMGKEPVVYSPQGPPPNLRFLPGADHVIRTVDSGARFDVSIACDAGEIARLGAQFPDADRRGLVLNLDHHPRSKAFGEVNLVDSQASAVGVLVWRLLKLMGRPVTKDIATCLWVSIVTDTGSFRHANTNAECMRIACELVEKGVRPGEVSSRMYESQPLARVKLLGQVLSTLALNASGQIAWVTATKDLFDVAGTSEETTDGFISYPRSIAGVEVAILFREEAPGRLRVSFRSRGKVDVGTIATRWGGGGHHNAAGCSVEGGMDEVRANVVREVERLLERLPRRSEAG